MATGHDACCCSTPPSPVMQALGMWLCHTGHRIPRIRSGRPVRSHRHGVAMRSSGLAAIILLLSSPGIPAQDEVFDTWSEAVAAEIVRAAPLAATSTQYFSGAEQDALDRQLTPITREY